MRKPSVPREVFKFCVTGGTVAAAAEKFSISIEAVRRHCSAHGLELQQPEPRLVALPAPEQDPNPGRKLKKRLVFEFVRDGGTEEEAATKYKIGVLSVKNYCRHYRLMAKREPARVKEPEAAVDLKLKALLVFEFVRDGGTVAAAAEHFGINSRTVKNYCRKHGLMLLHGVKSGIQNDPVKLTSVARQEALDIVRGNRAYLARKAKYYAEQVTKDPAYVVIDKEAAAMKNMAATIQSILAAHPRLLELEEEDAPEETGTDPERSARQRAAFGLEPKHAVGEG